MRPDRPARFSRLGSSMLVLAGIMSVVGAGCGRSSNDAPTGSAPAPACEATLLGCDLDGDGVRDDVERAIIAKYPDSARSREALFQDARALESYMASSSSSVSPDDAAAKAVQCMEYVLGLSQTPPTVHWIFGQVFNRVDRANAYFAAPGQSGAFPVSTDQASACSFDVDGLPN